jgi:hypothetical protein
MEIKEGYKVTDPNNSSISLVDEVVRDKVVFNKGITIYKVDEWVGRKKGNGPLAVFRTYKAAKSFAERRIPWVSKIYNCRYVPSKQKSLWIKDKACFSLRLSRFLPHGTDFANKVMLIEEVE